MPFWKIAGWNQAKEGRVEGMVGWVVGYGESVSLWNLW